MPSVPDSKGAPACRRRYQAQAQEYKQLMGVRWTYIGLRALLACQ
jgi:hypothetical protein